MIRIRSRCVLPDWRDTRTPAVLRPPAGLADDVRVVGDVGLPRQQRLAEGVGEVDEVSAP